MLPVTEYSFNKGLSSQSKSKKNLFRRKKNSNELDKEWKIKKRTKSTIMGYSRLSTAYTASLSPKRMNKTCKCSSLFVFNSNSFSKPLPQTKYQFLWNKTDWSYKQKKSSS